MTVVAKLWRTFTDPISALFVGPLNTLLLGKTVRTATEHVGTKAGEGIEGIGNAGAEAIRAVQEGAKAEIGATGAHLRERVRVVGDTVQQEVWNLSAEGTKVMQVAASQINHTGAALREEIEKVGSSAQGIAETLRREIAATGETSRQQQELVGKSADRELERIGLAVTAAIEKTTVQANKQLEVLVRSIVCAIAVPTGIYLSKHLSSLWAESCSSEFGGGICMTAKLSLITVTAIGTLAVTFGLMQVVPDPPPKPTEA